MFVKARAVSGLFNKMLTPQKKQGIYLSGSIGTGINSCASLRFGGPRGDLNLNWAN